MTVQTLPFLPLQTRKAENLPIHSTEGRRQDAVRADRKDTAGLRLQGLRSKKRSRLAGAGMRSGQSAVHGYILAGVVPVAWRKGWIVTVCRLVFVFLLTNIPFIGQWGIWWTTALTWFCTALLAFGRFMSGKWKDRGIVKWKNQSIRILRSLCKCRMLFLEKLRNYEKSKINILPRLRR